MGGYKDAIINPPHNSFMNGRESPPPASSAVTTLDAPPTPWEQDDPFADTVEEPGKDPAIVAEEALQSELDKINIEENTMNDDEETESDEKVTRDLWAIVCMVPTWYPRKGDPKAVLMQNLPSPDRMEIFRGSEDDALGQARQHASNVLDMPPDMRREFLAYNVCGPYNQEEVDNFDKIKPLPPREKPYNAREIRDHDWLRGPKNAERPENRGTRYIVSTRVYKKGTKNCQVSRLRPVGSGPPKHDFGARFPGGYIPVEKIMVQAHKMGVEGSMRTLLMSHMDENEIQNNFGDVEPMKE